MRQENLNDKDFAERVGISPGTLSNIMGGRNNPSLDVMTRILNVFRTVSSDWLILGVGPMYRTTGTKDSVLTESEAVADSPSLFTSPTLPEEPTTTLKEDVPVVRRSAKPETTSTQKQQVRRVEKILVFYTDGTFEER